MKHSKTLMIAAAALSTAFGTMAIAHTEAHADTSATTLAPAAPIIAVVDLVKVYESLDELKARENDMKAAVAARQEEMQKLSKELEDDAKEIQNLPPGLDRQKRVQAFLEKQATAKVKKEVYEALLDQQRAESFRELYEKITLACKKIAESQGITMVIVNDDSVKIPPGSSTADVQRIITNKRILFVNKTHDISDEVISQLNLEYKNAPRR